MKNCRSDSVLCTPTAQKGLEEPLDSEWAKDQITQLWTWCLPETVLEAEDARVSKTQGVASAGSSSLLGRPRTATHVYLKRGRGQVGSKVVSTRPWDSAKPQGNERRGLRLKPDHGAEEEKLLCKSLFSLKIDSVLDSRNYFFFQLEITLNNASAFSINLT